MKNTRLLLLVLVVGFVGYFIHSNNISIINFFKGGGFSSPYGPKPGKLWEQKWEAERLK